MGCFTDELAQSAWRCAERNEERLMCCAAAHKANWAEPRGSGGGPWGLNGSDAGEGAASAVHDRLAPEAGRRDPPAEARAGRSLDAVVAAIAAVSRGRGRAVP